MAEEHENKSPHMDTDKTDEEVYDTGPAFCDDNLYTTQTPVIIYTQHRPRW
jgi:hypothetical protein